MLKITSSLILSVGIALLLTNCAYNKKEAAIIPVDTTSCKTKEEIKYPAVATIFVGQECISCHDVGQTSPDLSTYATTKAYISANEVKFLKAINQQNSDVNKNMPQGSGPMPADNIKTIETWICQGMNP